MTTYNTQNPLGSSDPRDLYDNAENLDNFVNGAQPAYDDRLGQARKSWAGMEQDFADFLASSGYQFIGDYAAGIEVTAYNQVVRDGGEFWRAAADAELPYTATGAGLPEGGNFVAIGDAALRQELGTNITGQGSDLIAHTGTADTVTGALDKRTIYVGSVADLLALPTSALPDGQQVSVKEYQPGTGVGGGVFYWDSDSSEPDDGGLVFGSAPQGRWKRAKVGAATPEHFGAAGNGATDDTTAVLSADATGDLLLQSEYRVTGPISLTATNVSGPGKLLALGAGVTLVSDHATIERIEVQVLVGAAAFYGGVLILSGQNVYIGYAEADGKEEGSSAIVANGNGLSFGELHAKNSGNQNGVTFELSGCTGEMVSAENSGRSGVQFFGASSDISIGHVIVRDFMQRNDQPDGGIDAYYSEANNIWIGRCEVYNDLPGLQAQKLAINYNGSNGYFGQITVKYTDNTPYTIFACTARDESKPSKNLTFDVLSTEFPGMTAYIMSVIGAGTTDKSDNIVIRGGVFGATERVFRVQNATGKITADRVTIKKLAEFLFSENSPKPFDRAEFLNCTIREIGAGLILDYGTYVVVTELVIRGGLYEASASNTNATLVYSSASRYPNVLVAGITARKPAAMILVTILSATNLITDGNMEVDL